MTRVIKETVMEIENRIAATQEAPKTVADVSPEAKSSSHNSRRVQRLQSQGWQSCSAAAIYNHLHFRHLANGLIQSDLKQTVE